MDIGKRIKKLRESLKLTQEEFGMKVGLSSGAISEIEKGIRGHKKGIGSTAVTRICKVFKVDPTWLLTGEQPIAARSPVIEYGDEECAFLPIAGDVPAGYPVVPIENPESHLLLPVSLVKDSQAFILKVDGDSMEPEILNGDLVVVSPSQKTEVKGKGERAVVRIDSGEAAIKLVHKEKKGIILSSRNPKYPPIFITDDQTLEIIGKIILKIHFY